MTDERIISYLLNELPGEESEQFEDECFAQESWPDQLASVEEDLIDFYLRDELTTERRRRFETDYLTTDARRERVRMAAALLRHVDERASDAVTAAAAAAAVASPLRQTWFERFLSLWSRENWATPAAAALLAVAVIVAGVWWLSSPRQAAPAQPLEVLVLNVSHGNRATGIDASGVKLSLARAGLKISLLLPPTPLPSPPAAHYRFELESEDSQIKFAGKATQEAQFVPVEIPAGLLARGTFAVKLYAVSHDGAEQRIGGTYFFNVE